jgi:hypothetical protein
MKASGGAKDNESEGQLVAEVRTGHEKREIFLILLEGGWKIERKKNLQDS